jgi:hypothetical protein
MIRVCFLLSCILLQGSFISFFFIFPVSFNMKMVVNVLLLFKNVNGTKNVLNKTLPGGSTSPAFLLA